MKRSGILLPLLTILASCAQPTPVPQPSPTLLAPTATKPSVTPTVGEVATVSTEELAEQGCGDTHGRMVQAELVDEALPRSLPYRIYLPPCADELRGHLPALYLLHGLARTDAQWDDLNADEVAERLVVSQQAPPFLMVMPWERLGLDYEETIVDYLIPHIESEYGASSERSLRSIGGISRGAGWALRIGLQRPELFRSIGLHSPAVLVPDIYSIPGWLETIPTSEQPDIWLDVGDRDPLRLSLPELTALFDNADLRYELRSYPGEHIESYWEAHVEDYLRWYVSGWPELELDDLPQ